MDINFFDDWGGLDSSSEDEGNMFGSPSESEVDSDQSDPEDMPHLLESDAEREVETFLGKEMFQGLKLFVDSEDLSDVDVKVGNVTFKCHKVILAAWSPYFRALFSSGMVEARQGSVHLSSIEPEEFKELLQILYGGDYEIPVEHVEELTYAASYLQIRPIEKECEKIMLRNLDDPENNFSYLYTVRQLQLNQTAQEILNHIVGEFDHHSTCVGLTKLSYEDICFILDCEKITGSEEIICDALFAWIEADMENRKPFARDLLSKIRYLALSHIYMIHIFLKHPLVKENADLESMRNACFAYLRQPLEQNSYIGEREAMHRNGSSLTDCILVCHTNKISCLREKKDPDGSLHFVPLQEYNLPMPVNLNPLPRDLSVCSYGRSEMFMSNGFELYRYKGLVGQWTAGPTSKLHRLGNCLLTDTVNECIFSVTASAMGIGIERYKVRRDGIKEEWTIVYNEMDPQSSLEKSDVSSAVTENKTCAYMVDSNIFILHTSNKYRSKFIVEDSDTAVVTFNKTTRTICFISHLPIPGTCVAAVSYQNLVFLIDENCKNVLRVSNNGTCIETYGEIGHDDPNYVNRHHFAMCMWRGRIIITGGEYPSGSRLSYFRVNECLDYDLDSHCTVRHRVEPQNYNTSSNVCRSNVVKLTIKWPLV